MHGNVERRGLQRSRPQPRAERWYVSTGLRPCLSWDFRAQPPRRLLLRVKCEMSYRVPRWFCRASYSEAVLRTFGEILAARTANNIAIIDDGLTVEVPAYCEQDVYMEADRALDILEKSKLIKVIERWFDEEAFVTKTACLVTIDWDAADAPEIYCAPPEPPWWFLEKRGRFYRIWKKTEGYCWYCGASVGWAFEADHQKPRSRGGSGRVDNLVPACAPCNRAKASRDLEQYRVAVGGSEYRFWFERGAAALTSA